MDQIKRGLTGEAAKLIIEHARDYAILLLDLDGRILSWSPGAERITGLPAEEAVGSDFQFLFTPSDRAVGQDRVELEKAWADGRAEDSRWHVRRDGTRFWANGVTMAVRDGATPMLIKIIRDETQNKLADEQRTLLLNELNHRINNTLVTVQSLVEQTLRAADLGRGVRDDLTARLQALSQAHRALMEQNWAGAELSDLVKRTLAPFDAGTSERFTIEGPPLRLSPQQAVSFSLVLHELATNAVKHGALSNAVGHVAVHWNNAVDDHGGRRMTFLWAERGGPPVAEPNRRGFGSRLFERSFPDPTVGGARVEFPTEGARCVISLKLSSDEEAPLLDLLAAARGA
jgi:PAS domain S-box-containing protein